MPEYSFPLPFHCYMWASVHWMRGYTEGVKPEFLECALNSLSWAAAMLSELLDCDADEAAEMLADAILEAR